MRKRLLKNLRHTLEPEERACELFADQPPLHLETKAQMVQGLINEATMERQQLIIEAVYLNNIVVPRRAKCVPSGEPC